MGHFKGARMTGSVLWQIAPWHCLGDAIASFVTIPTRSWVGKWVHIRLIVQFDTTLTQSDAPPLNLPMIRTNNEHRSWLQLYYPYYILPIPSGTEWAIPFHLDWFPQIQRLLVKHNIVNAAVKEAVCLVFLRQNKIRFWKGSDTLHISSWCNLMISQE